MNPGFNTKHAQAVYGQACLITLGCPKNTVESEKMAGLLQAGGWALTTKTGRDVAVVVHTCSFINDARKESEDVIRSVCSLKKKGLIGKLYVTGCLAQEAKNGLKKAFPGIDGILGTGELEKLAGLLRGSREKPEFIAGGLLDTSAPRLLSSASSSAYLRIAEGCGHKCSFCVIPGLRGKYKSRSMEAIAKEAGILARSGIREIVLIAQDTTLYGKDLYGRPMLHALMRRLAGIKDIKWIRLLYAYPDTVTDKILDVMRTEPKICKYIDIPLQHISDTVLRRMKRKPGALKTIQNLKFKIPNLTVRTSFITGFPGETKEEFDELLKTVQSGFFDHAGVFEFSPHPDAPASSLPGRVPARIAAQRKSALMLAQRKIVRKNNASLIGSTVEVLVEHEKDGLCRGRTAGQAPEIDSLVFFKGRNVKGPFAKVRITGFKGYDLIGKLFHLRGISSLPKCR